MENGLEMYYPTDYPEYEHITSALPVMGSYNTTSCSLYFAKLYNLTASESPGNIHALLAQILPPYCQSLLFETAGTEFMETIRASTVIRTVLGLVYSLVMAMCGIGNLLLLIVIFCYKKSRSATNMLISNLCCADFFVAVFCIPLQLDYYVMKDQAWVWGGSMCAVVSYIRMTTLYASTNTLLVISIDRCLVVRRQFNGRKTRRSVAVVLAVVWLISALIAVPSALYAKIIPQQNGKDMFCRQVWPVSQVFASKAYFVFLMVAEYAVPSCCMALCLLFVWYKVWGRRFPGHENSSIRRAREKSRKKTIHLLVLVIMFVVCWAPYYIYSLVQNFFDVLHTYHLNTDLFYIAEVFAKSNSMINTVAFIVFNENIMKYVRSLIGYLRMHLESGRGLSRYGSQPTVRSSLRRRPVMVEVEMAVMGEKGGGKGKIFTSSIRRKSSSIGRNSSSIRHNSSSARNNSIRNHGCSTLMSQLSPNDSPSSHRL